MALRSIAQYVTSRLRAQHWTLGVGCAFPMSSRSTSWADKHGTTVTLYGVENGELEWCSPDKPPLVGRGDWRNTDSARKAMPRSLSYFYCAIIGIISIQLSACFCWETHDDGQEAYFRYELSLQELRDIFRFSNNVVIALVPDERRTRRIVLPNATAERLRPRTSRRLSLSLRSGCGSDPALPRRSRSG